MNKNSLLTLYSWDNAKGVSYQIVSGRTLRIQSSAAYIDTRMDNAGKVSQVSFEERFCIKQGEVLKIVDEDFPMQFKVREIQPVSNVNNMFLLNSHKRTLSSHFLVPMLGKNREYFSFESYFVNAYLHKTSSRKEKLKFLYLLYMFSSSTEFSELETRLNKHPMYISCTSPDRTHLLYTFRIPEEYHNDVPLFLLGKYSKFSEPAKKAIIKFHGFGKSGIMYKILSKDEGLKKSMEKKLASTIPSHVELFDRPSWATETYTDKLKDS